MNEVLKCKYDLINLVKSVGILSLLTDFNFTVVVIVNIRKKLEQVTSHHTG